MPLQIGLVGLPNVGKSTLFNALTRSSAAVAANFPFCTIDPNVGVVPVEDERLEAIGKIVNAKRIVPETIEFVDIAGLVKGASQGEGLGNQFLANIRECDAVAMVIRFFEDPDTIHVSGKVDPRSDREIIEMELVLADLQSVEKAHEKAKRNMKSGKAEDALRASALEKIYEKLSAGERANKAELTEEEQFIKKEFPLLTGKPFLFIANIDENAGTNFDSVEAKKILGLDPSDEIVPISAKIESELAGLSAEESAEFLADLGLTESGIQKLARSAQNILGISRFFTAGEIEARAWTIPFNASAPKAAGKIHGDFEKKFIRADVIAWEKFVECGGWAKAREKGMVRSEGKEYAVQDGDVCLFKTGA